MTTKDPAAPVATSSDVPRVLIVDDDPILARVVSRYLQRHGLETEWAGDAQAALTVVERQRPDLVLLDVMLPGRDVTTSAGICARVGTCRCSC